MDSKRVAKETAQTLSSYLTYRAVRLVISQLSETNPPQAYKLSQISTETIQDGEAYLQHLMGQDPEMAFRIMTVRQHLAEEICDYLPEMVKSQIQQTNMEHRRQHLERLTQLTVSDPVPPEPPND